MRGPEVFRIKPFDQPEVVSRRLMRIPYGVYVKAGTPHPSADGAGCGRSSIAWSTGSPSELGLASN